MDSSLCTWHTGGAPLRSLCTHYEPWCPPALPGRTEHRPRASHSPEPPTRTSQPVCSAQPPILQAPRSPLPSSQPQALHVAPPACPPCTVFGTPTKTDSRDRHPTLPDHPGWSGTCRAGKGLSPVQVTSTKVQTQSRDGHSHREVAVPATAPPPRARPPREVTSTRGIFCSGPSARALRVLSHAGSSSSRHRFPRGAQRRHRRPCPAPLPRPPGSPEGAATLATTKGAPRGRT